MPETARLFRLDDDAGGLGLSCDAGGLALAGVPLLYRTAAGFAPRPRDELDLLLRHANQGRGAPLALSDSGLRAVASALNRGDLAKAQMAAVFMRVPELDPDTAVRLILADDTLAKFNPGQPRDDHGRWTAGDQHQTSSLTTTVAHEIGHTPLGRKALNLPTLPSSSPIKDENGDFVMIMGPTPSRVQEELRATRLFENPARKALGLPPRTSYYEENDVLTGGKP
jgi:hypothetical protein